MTKIALVLVFILGTGATVVYAAWPPPPPPSWTPPPTVHRAPEIDPASAIAGLTLLAGGLAVLRGRRSGK